MDISQIRQQYASFQQQAGNSLPLSRNVTATGEVEGTKANTEKNQGIDIRNKPGLDLSQYQLKEFSPPLAELPEPMTPEQYEAQLRKQGNVQQNALITQNGEVVGSIGSGFTSFQGNIASVLHQAGFSPDSDPQAMQEFLNEKYDGKVQLEVFPEGKGPTYAQVHEQVYGSSFDALVSRQTDAQKLYHQQHMQFTQQARTVETRA